MTKGTPARPQTGAARRASRAKYEATKIPLDPRLPLDARPLLSIEAAARYLDISRWTVYRLIREGALTPITVSRTMKVSPSDLDAYIKRQARAS